ncbi:thioredoxin-dependent thiol peroxidase [Rothia sp. P7181]|uniref:thioredoxin-dependent thiol peroxidase n=1 Tax=unclassified Rothia (in: high G+C Gram-positive bacteria) TaxID=2689056 RepID=UPI003AEEDDF0
MAERLDIGTPAPAFSLKNSNGEIVSLEQFSGQKVVLYFYPKANTPGCTNQACDFRDNIASLQSHGYVVLGVSPDSPQALQNFTQKQELNFELLSDEDHTVAESYGAWGEKKNYGKTYIGLIRSTFVIDENGNISLAQYNVRAKGHVAKLRRDLGIDPS